MSPNRELMHFSPTDFGHEFFFRITRHPRSSLSVSRYEASISGHIGGIASIDVGLSIKIATIASGSAAAMAFLVINCGLGQESPRQSTMLETVTLDPSPSVTLGSDGASCDLLDAFLLNNPIAFFFVLKYSFLGRDCSVTTLASLPLSDALINKEQNSRL